MIAYGAAFFALTGGDTAVASSLWPLIDWCNAYLLRKKSPEGVIASESDELEGRFPAGKINLSTNVLAYASFRYGAKLATILGKPTQAKDWQIEAETLKKISTFTSGHQLKVTIPIVIMRVMTNCVPGSACHS
ncbi:hypothetical protein [Paraflavitalea speifideaquila]|uniref:hypothetical protein n=1 Tax=Paraflavitalea speifideaquila TaxID=3076558 RepID=UPI0028E7F167|nr:hypothetical protein [Paraflavitalea speifideiaquila]